jgi:diguanylate cyclase (GGDEF)-like protein/PAS domain S-box-containing protein
LTTPSSFWPEHPACCLARSAQEQGLLVARLAQEALQAGKVIFQIGENPVSDPPAHPNGQIHYLSYAEFHNLAQDTLGAQFGSSLPEDTVILAAAPTAVQENHLSITARMAGIQTVCIYRQDQIELNRLFDILNNHRHFFTVDGWLSHPLEDLAKLEGGAEAVNEPARLREITNNIPFLIAYLDQNITYRFVNEPFSQWFGLPRSAIIGHSMNELFDEATYQVALPHIQMALNGQKTSFVNHVQHVDGSIHKVHITYTPDHQSDGKVRGFISGVEDITYQTQVEEQLRQSEYRLRTIISNFPILIFTVDMNGIITLAEGKGLQAFGMESTGVVGKSAFDLFRDNKLLLKSLHRALAGETFQEMISDQQGLIFDTWYSPLVNSDGSRQGMLGISANVTERTQAELALKVSEERYRTLVENQSEGVLILDADLRIEYANLAAAGILKRPAVELIGLQMDRLLRLSQKRILKSQFELRKKNERSTYELDFNPTKDEKKRLIISATPRFDSTGAFLGSFAVIRDITERKLVEEDLRYRSTHDALTGVHNRFFFDEELSRLEENHRQPISVLMVDLDRLKAINDTQGHFAGDEVLRRVANLLRACLRGEDLVARLGGDEFAVLLPNTRQAERERIIERMQRMVKKSNQKHTDLPVSVSIGGATAMPGESLLRALKEADQRLYDVKREKYRSDRLAK